jgi:NDP-sugar pyrophosphorylase family protein
MRAMILAAGLGTRLRPLTDSRPKALVEIGGRTLLEIAVCRVRDFGVREVIINVHHFADMVVEYLKRKDNFGINIAVSREEVLLDTGGGLKKAAYFFEQPKNDQPFLLHNVDVISNIDLGAMVEYHNTKKALATLAVQERKSTRQLLFGENCQLGGRQADDKKEVIRAAAHMEALAFSGIHVISPRLLALMNEEGAFSIISTYLRLSEKGEKIVGFRSDQYYWRDVGNARNLAQAADDLKQRAQSN